MFCYEFGWLTEADVYVCCLQTYLNFLTTVIIPAIATGRIFLDKAPITSNSE